MSDRSARDRLFFVASDDMPVTSNEVNEAIDAYAHELAEKIRHSKKLRDWTDDHMSDCNMAADLIDPEVPHGG